MLRPRTLARLLVVSAVLVALVLVGATSALAAPSDPVLHFSDLRAKLAEGHLSGYMKTVVEGSTIVQIPVNVLAVPSTGGAADSLIMFEATGPLMAKFGGIVDGMSGSPIYVNDGTGTDKLIGAVSYGDEFTLGGTGLATPIDAMSAIETDFGVSAPLSAPVITSNGVVNQIIVAPNPQDFAGAAAAGAFVAKPLASVFIGGLNPNSSGYKALAKDMAAHGVRVVALNKALASGVEGEAPFSTEMTGGASVAALAARGDLWVGGIGTVTYANNGNVLAYGHPAYWSGATSLYMANAWIEGVWPSSAEPYKVGEPGALSGTVTQDRQAGILGKLGEIPAETVITARATNLDRTTNNVTTSTVYVPRKLLSTGFADSYLVGMGAYVAGSKLFDQRTTPGSAHTTCTVTLRDGDTTRTVVMANYISSTSDIAQAVIPTVQTAISTLQSVLAYGTADLQIVKVDLTGEYSATRADAQIVRIDAPNGIHIGANRIRVDALVYGMDATQTVETTLTIPAGTPLGGTLSVTPASYNSDNAMSSGDMWGVTFKRKTIAGLVDQLNATLPDTTMLITYAPSGYSGPVDEYGDPIDSPATTLKTVTMQATAPWPVAGQARSYVTTIKAMLLPNPISYGGFFEGIVGEVDGPSAPTTVTVYARTAGSSADTTIATVVATPYDGILEYEVPIMKSYTKNTAFRIHVDGADTSTGADTTVVLGVKVTMSLKSSATKIKRGKSVTLSTSIYPSSAAGGSVVFEQLSGKKWVQIAKKTLTVAGTKAVASTGFKPAKGTRKVRVRFLGGTYNTATTSGVVTLTVK
jgi:hypothetical protein